MRTLIENQNLENTQDNLKLSLDDKIRKFMEKILLIK
jgi:hypothetical protein